MGSPGRPGHRRECPRTAFCAWPHGPARTGVIYYFYKINLNFSQFKDYNKMIQDLNKNLKEIEAIQNDPEDYISEYLSGLTRQVDLRRETLIEEINKYSDEIIQKIDKIKQDRVAKSKETTKFTDGLGTINGKINELN